MSKPKSEAKEVVPEDFDKRKAEAAEKVKDVYNQLCEFFFDQQINPTLAAIACNSVIQNLINKKMVSENVRECYIESVDLNESLN